MANPANSQHPHTPHTPHLAFSVADGAVQIGLRATTLWQCIAAGLITPIKVGRRTLLPYTELQRFLALSQAEIDAARSLTLNWRKPF